MPSRVSKEKAKPRKATGPRKGAEPKPISTKPDESLILLWLCFKNCGGGSVSWDNVAHLLNCTPKAAKSRFHRLKSHMDPIMEAMVKAKEENPESACKSAEQDDQDEGEDTEDI